MPHFIKTLHHVVNFFCSDVLNIKIYYCDLINFLKILRSWPQNKYHPWGPGHPPRWGWRDQSPSTRGFYKFSIFDSSSIIVNSDLRETAIPFPSKIGHLVLFFFFFSLSSRSWWWDVRITSMKRRTRPSVWTNSCRIMYRVSTRIHAHTHITHTPHTPYTHTHTPHTPYTHTHHTHTRTTHTYHTHTHTCPTYTHPNPPTSHTHTRHTHTLYTHTHIHHHAQNQYKQTRRY